MSITSLTSRRGSLAGLDERGEAEGYWCEKGQQAARRAAMAAPGMRQHRIEGGQ